MALMEESHEFDTLNSEISYNQSNKNNNRNVTCLEFYLSTLILNMGQSNCIEI